MLQHLDVFFFENYENRVFASKNQGVWDVPVFGVVTLGCLTQAFSGIPEAPSTHMSGTWVPSAIVSCL